MGCRVRRHTRSDRQFDERGCKCNGDRVARGPSVTVLDDLQGRIGTDDGAPVGARVANCPDGRRIGLVRRRLSKSAAQSALSKLLLIISRWVYWRGLNRIPRSRYGHGNHGTT